MNENATKGIEMDKERIAMLVLQIRRAMTEELIVVTLPQNWVTPALDALESAQAELSAARERIRELNHLLAGVPDLVKAAFQEGFALDGSLGPAWDGSRAKLVLDGEATPRPPTWDRDRSRIATLEAQIREMEAGVVPEHPTQDQIRRAGYTRPGARAVQDFVNGWASLARVLKVQSAPSSRVAGEGLKTPVVKKPLIPAPVSYPTAYALRVTNPEATEGGWRTCRSCDNYCRGPMNCDGYHESTCLSWIPRPDHDIDGEHKDAKARRLSATKGES